MADDMPDRRTTELTTRPKAGAWRCAAALAAFVLVLLPGLVRLASLSGGQAFAPPDGPAVRHDIEVREHFQVRDPVVILVETTHPDGIYNLETLHLVQGLSGALAGVDGIGPDQVASLATERRDRLFPGTLVFRPFLDPLPTTSHLMSLLKSDVDAADVLTGTLVSADRKATAILAGIPDAGRTALCREILRTAESFATPANRISVAGSPVADALLASRAPQILLVCLLWLLALVPAVLFLLRSERIARRWMPLSALFLLTALLGWGVSGLAHSDGWLGGVVRGNAFREATARVNAKLHGSRILLADVTFSPPAGQIPKVRDRQGPLLDPAALRALGDLEAFIRTQPGVGGAVGPHANFVTVSYLWLGRQPEGRSIADDPARIEHTFRMYDRLWGELRRRQVVDDDLRRGLVTIYLKSAPYRGTAKLMDAIRGYERERLGAVAAKTGFAGEVAVRQVVISKSFLIQIASLGLAGCLLALAARLGAPRPARFPRRAAELPAVSPKGGGPVL